MAIERVRAYLEQYGAADRVLEFGVSSATVELAAKAGDCKIDNAKYKAKFHAKARMLTPPEVEEHIGHAVGGVCPFGVNDGVAVYLDESLRRFGTVFPACGSSNSAIELTVGANKNMAVHPFPFISVISADTCSLFLHFYYLCRSYFQH